MYMNLNGILFDLISKEEFNKVLETKKIKISDICEKLNISESKYTKLINGKSDFSELHIIKLEKFLNIKMLKPLRRI